MVNIPFLDAVEIHNVWVRLAAEGGIFLVASFAAVVLSILGKAIDVLWRATNSGSKAKVVETAALLTSLLGGIVISLVEPNIFFGTMHASSIWWVVAGAVVARYFAGQKTSLTLEERIFRINATPTNET